MGLNIFAAYKGLKYFLFSRHKYGHGIHSPFVYTFIREVLRDKNQYAEYNIIERHRKTLLSNNTKIHIQDFGAGSYSQKSEYRSISSIAKTGISTKKYAQLLYRIVRYTQSKHILELGSSLGISGAYLSLSHPHTQLYSLEGSPELSRIAKNTFTACGAHNAEVICGNFNKTLLPCLKNIKQVDLVYIDGNHTKQATLEYFEQIIPYCNEDSILIFDDIYWSKGMNDAWNIIKRNKHTSISIDIYKFGIIFFRKGILKQDFTIRF